MQSIYIIQVRVSNTGIERRNKRSIGWFETFEEAEKCLLANPATFSDDGYYKVALIEKVPPGPYSIGLSDEEPFVKWYKLEGNTTFENFDAKYVEASDLKQEGVIGFTMG